MEIIPFTRGDANVRIDILSEQFAQGKTASTCGIASFPARRRHAEKAHSAHEGTEMPRILKGEFDVETADGVVTVAKDHLVVIPAREPHAILARQSGHVAHFLINEIEE